MRLLPRRRAAARTDARVVHQIAAWSLGYPDAEFFGRIDLMRSALDETAAGESADALRGFLDHAASADPSQLAQHYTDVFDLSRKQTLYLSYWSAGDTRRRGSVLTDFKQLYRDSGFVVDLHGELPDHLPVVLEFAALADPERGVQVLTENRPSLELIRLSLVDAGSPYADVLAAVCATLPGQSPPDRASALAMAGPERAVETVGLEPYDARLLPLFTTDDFTSNGFTDSGEEAYR
ncbi:nitrate reductase molybdenum cofactor assembly chaperone [Gordonia sp. PS3]|uniref:nitrate reductase molybdenum cofactor assembly chaperone n=1 Tax=Gordonia TaxID=2053 RepID=UPI0005F03809|nr:nitrate reductase molybdenum cofactor assembly chaperone [Gordonia sihwensis]KJR09545.1 nitrate reductase [Gordonia sihwensis]